MGRLGSGLGKLRCALIVALECSPAITLAAARHKLCQLSIEHGEGDMAVDATYEELPGVRYRIVGKHGQVEVDRATSLAPNTDWPAVERLAAPIAAFEAGGG